MRPRMFLICSRGQPDSKMIKYVGLRPLGVEKVRHWHSHLLYRRKNKTKLEDRILLFATCWKEKKISHCLTFTGIYIQRGETLSSRRLCCKGNNWTTTSFQIWRMVAGHVVPVEVICIHFALISFGNPTSNNRNY